MASRRATKQEILQVRTALAIAYPACFAKKGEKKKPLKIGIKDDVMASAREIFPGLSRRLIAATIRDYCTGANYLRCLVAGAARVDIKGTFAGFVSAEHASHAQKTLADIKSRSVRKAPATKAKRPDIGATSLGTASVSVVSREGRLMSLRQQIAAHEAGMKAAEMSDDFYYTSGRRTKDMVVLASMKAEASALEEA